MNPRHFDSNLPNQGGEETDTHVYRHRGLYTAHSGHTNLPLSKLLVRLSVVLLPVAGANLHVGERRLGNSRLGLVRRQCQRVGAVDQRPLHLRAVEDVRRVRPNTAVGRFIP